MCSESGYHGIRYLSSSIGDKASLGVDVDRLAADSAERPRHLNIDGKLHAQLRLAHPWGATELGDLGQWHTAAEHRVKGAAERGNRRLCDLCLKELKCRLALR